MPGKPVLFAPFNAGAYTAKASYWMILGLVWRVKLSKTVFYLLIATVVDYFFWPYIFREEVQDQD